MKEYATWQGLVNGAQMACRDILDKDVAPVAERIVKQHIQKDIYGTYKPKKDAWVNGTTYQRRHTLKDSVYHKIIKNETLLITSNETASKSIIKGWSFRNRYPGAFLKLLEQGNMGIWKGGFPRPAIKNAQQTINNSNSIENAINKGIRREFQQR